MSLSVQAQNMATSGSVGVGQNGAATYAMPIVLPPGIAGMAPKLGLQYNSQGGNGLLGLGWSLSGMSSITRCSATQASDGIRGSVTYVGTDRFCLDGQKLTLISGTYGASGSVYRTERDGFSNIVANGALGNGPASFTVKTKAGQTLQYGSTTDSAVLAQGKPTVRLWALNKVTDTVGNYMSVAYTPDTTNGSYYPLSISYTGNGSQAPSSSVAFGYTSRTDQIPVYTAGSLVKNTQLLSTIKTYANENLVKTYSLTYKAQTYGSNLSALTSVQEIFADGSTLPATQITWPTYLSFANGCTVNCGQSFAATPQASIADTAQSYTGWQMVSAALTNSGRTDLVGYSVSGSTLQIQAWLSNGSGAFTKQAAISAINLGAASKQITRFAASQGGASTGTTLQVGDIDGDGIPDLVIPTCSTVDSSLTVTVLKGKGDGTFGAATSTPYAGTNCAGVANFRLTDQNGTGQADLIWVTADSGNVSVWGLLNNGTGGFNTPSGLGTGAMPTGFTVGHIQSSVYWADINDDGIPDLVMLYANGNSIAMQYWPGQSNGLLGSPVTALTYTGTPGNSSYTYQANYSLVLADLNGAGAPELLALGKGTSGASVDVWAGVGGGQFSAVQKNAISSNVGNLTGWDVRLADVNGDGLVDIVYASANAAAGARAAYVFLGNGDGNFTQAYGAASNTGTSAAGTTGWSTLVSDLSGTGRADLLAWNPAASGMYVQSWTNAMPGAPTLVSKIDNGLGAYSNFNYSSLSNPAVYTVGSAVNYPLVNLNLPFNVVSSVVSPDGVGGLLTTNYSYSGLRAELFTGRGVLGFAAMTTSQQQGANTVSTTSTFSQSWPFTGMPLTVATSNSAASGPSHQIDLVVNTFGCTNPQTGYGCAVAPGNIYFPYVSQAIKTSWDLDGTALPTTTTTNTFDSFGNALVASVGTGDGYSQSTANTYINDTSNWFLGLLTQSAVTSITPAGSATRTSAFTYNASNGLRMSETIEPTLPQLCQTTSYVYDGYGNKTGSTTANCSGASGTALFTSRSSSSSTAATTANPIAGQFVTSASNALSQQETRQYDMRFGGPTSLTGPNSLTTTWNYDALGRPILEARADGNKTQTQYLYCVGFNGGSTSCPTINGAQAAYVVVTTPLASSGSQNGAYSKVYIDALGRKLRTETQGWDGSGTSTAIYQDTQYNNLGQVLAVSRPYYAGQTAYWTTNIYDALGRAVSSTAADGSVTSNRYSGLVTTVTNANNQASTTTRNSQAQVVSVVDSNNQTTSFVYDPLGNLVSTKDVAQNIVTMQYDLRGRKTQMVDPDMGTWTYSYDALGQLVTQKDGKGNTSTMAYDVLGRMTARSEADLISNWYYDTYSGSVACPKGIGKLCQATTSTGYSRKLGYDSLGRANGTTTTLDTTYTDGATYDANGRVATRTYPGGVVLQYNFTPLGYLQSITRVSSGVVLWKANVRDAEGHLLQQTYGNGLATTQTFDPTNGRVKAITAGAGNAVQNASYQYDALGNVTNRNDQTQSLLETFGYDALNRLTTSTVNASATSYTNTYAYANSGNITARSDLGSYGYQTVSAAATQGYGCSTGTLTGSGSSSTCVTTTSVAPTVTYSCPSGQTLQGTQCLSSTNVLTPANAAYSCASGATLTGSGSSSTCVTTTSVAAKSTYTCPSNATLSGTNCVYSQTTAATPNYSCASGNLSGSNCVGTTTVGANVSSYSCPSGYSLSGTTCSLTTTTAAAQSFDTSCPSNVSGPPLTSWFQYQASAGSLSFMVNYVSYSLPYPAGSCAGSGFQTDIPGGAQACRAVPNRQLLTYKVADPIGMNNGRNTGYTTYCVYTPHILYSCSAGTLQGASCVVTTTANATPNYSCSSGTLSGSTCTVPTSVAATVSSYSCPAGQTVAGNTCVNTTTSSATANYSCTSGTLTGTGASSTCVTTTSVGATPKYTCTSGVLQSDNQCLLSNNTLVAANVQYVCTSGTQVGTGSTSTCQTTTSVAAQTAYSCPAGQSVSGSQCVATGVASASPHALTLVQLPSSSGSRFYGHDGNGNRASEVWQQGSAVANTRSYSYTSYNMPLTLASTSGSTTVSETYTYGPEHQRVKQVSSTLGTVYYLNPGNAGDLFYEKEIKPDNSVELRSYVTAGGAVIAEIKQITSSANVVSEQTRYFQRDGLGSTTVVSDEAGSVLERLAYEPFGKRRQVPGAQDPTNAVTDALGQRGFTNHEHMDELGLINMNGRVYDPMTARFMGADPHIQAPGYSQSFNRYSYVWNSPLNMSDPTGFDARDTTTNSFHDGDHDPVGQSGGGTTMSWSYDSDNKNLEVHYQWAFTPSSVNSWGPVATISISHFSSDPTQPNAPGLSPNDPYGHNGGNGAGASAGAAGGLVLAAGEMTPLGWAVTGAVGAVAIAQTTSVKDLKNLWASFKGLLSDVKASIAHALNINVNEEENAKDNELSKEDKKSIKSLEKNIKEHEDKLAEFKENPTVRPGMEDQPPDVIERQQQRRIRHLQGEIDNWNREINDILNGR